MAKKKKEKVAEQTPEKPIVDEKVEKIKVKKKPKQFKQQEGTIKIDLSKPPESKEDVDIKQESTEVVADKQPEIIQEIVEEAPQEELSPLLAALTKPV